MRERGCRGKPRINLTGRVAGGWEFTLENKLHYIQVLRETSLVTWSLTKGQKAKEQSFEKLDTPVLPKEAIQSK